MKPAALNLVTLILCIFNCYGIIGLFFLNMDAAIFKVYATIAVLFVIISFVVIWFFHKGRNWARILVLIASFFCFTNLYHFTHYPMFTKVILGGQMLFAAYLLYWLNSKEVTAYFKGL